MKLLKDGGGLKVMKYSGIMVEDGRGGERLQVPLSLGHPVIGVVASLVQAAKKKNLLPDCSSFHLHRSIHNFV